MAIRLVFTIGSVIMAGVAVGQHLGWMDGIAAAMTVYALMPYHPRS